jgi:hypothetical protein
MGTQQQKESVNLKHKVGKRLASKKSPVVGFEVMLSGNGIEQTNS